VLSAISAVVASSQSVTNHLASYVILVLVAPAIAAFFSTLFHKAVSPASQPCGTANQFFNVLVLTQSRCGM
jgi:hypothetical protein